MSESVNLPALGESVTEGTVTRWLKNVGDRVEVDEPLLEVSTDKVDTEIPSPIAGVIEAILVAEDETVEVGTPLVTIGDGSGSTDATPEASAEGVTEAVTPTLPEDAQPAPVAHAAPATVEPVAAPVSVSEQIIAPPQEPPVSAAEPVAQAPSPYAPAPEQHAPAEPVALSPAGIAEPALAIEATPEAASTEVASPTEAPVAVAPVTVAPVTVAPVAVAPITVTPVATPPAATTGPEAPATPAPAAPALDSKPGYFTPLVRKLANEKGIDLSTITGSGVGGRIRKEDLLTLQSEAAAAPDVAAAGPRATLETSPLRGTSVPMSRLRKVIAERAVISMQSSAQLTSVVEVDVTLVANFRDAVKAEFLAKTGQKLSFLPFFALAAAEALRAFPIINATIDGESIVYPSQENMAIAVDTERGLLTPVIRDAGSLDLAGLAAQIADLAARTRDNKLKPDELAGGTFTLTNTGSRGALFDTPIVFLPQSAILGTGIVAKKPVVVSSGGLDAIAIRSTVYLALSYDHRIVDGADAARFLVTVKTRLEGGDFAGDLGY